MSLICLKRMFILKSIIFIYDVNRDIYKTLSNYKYHIVAKLASGGYSTVYIGNSMEGEKVAMKVIEKKSALNVEDITLEVKIIKKVFFMSLLE